MFWVKGAVGRGCPEQMLWEGSLGRVLARQVVERLQRLTASQDDAMSETSSEALQAAESRARGLVEVDRRCFFRAFGKGVSDKAFHVEVPRGIPFEFHK